MAVIKQLSITIIVCALAVLGLVFPSPAQAQLMANLPVTAELVSVVETSKDLMTQLKTEILPKLENILFPEQRERFKFLVGEGTSFRKAFRALTLTPEQKTQLKGLLNSLPHKEALTTLTPEQKKQLFKHKQGLFQPRSAQTTPEARLKSNSSQE